MKAHPGPIAALIQRELLLRTLLPGLAGLLLVALFSGWMQMRAVEAQNQELARHLARYTERHLDGVWRALEHFAQGGRAITPATLEEKRSLLSSVDRLLLIGADSAVLGASPPVGSGREIPLDFDIVRERRLLQSRPRLSSDGNNVVVLLGVRLPGDQVLAAELNLSELTRQLEDMGENADTQVVVCDRFGNLISHPDRDMVRTQANIGDWVQFRAASRGTDTLIDRQGGELYLASQTRLTLAHWLVLVRKPALAALSPALAPVVGSAACMMLLLGVITLLLRRELEYLIAHPMAEAVSRLREQGLGETAAPVPQAPFAELQRLQDAISAQAGSILAGEKILRESERRFRAVFEQAAVGLSVMNAWGGFLRANARFQELTGYTVEELLTRTFRDVTHPEDLEQTVAAFQRLMDGRGGDCQLDQRYVRKDGSLRWVRKTLSAVRDDSGKLLNLVAVVEDVTGRKQAEDAVLRSLREKEVLLREIHHRVKNNLQVISSLLYLQTEHVADPGALAVLLESRGRIASMALVHEELYRSDDLSCVNMRDYVLKLVPRLLSAYCCGKELRHDMHVDDVTLLIDQAIPFGLVINELVTNAAKHAFVRAEKGTLRVDIREKEGHVTVHVADDGVGLPPDFNLGECSSLGMQLVVQLVRQLHGEVTAGTQNGGAAFSFSFVRKEAGTREPDQSHDR